MRRTSLVLLACALAAVGLTAGALLAEKPADVDKLNKKIDLPPLADAAGKPALPAALADKKAVVVVFLSFDCPVSCSYSPTLAALHKTYAGKDVAFLGVNASDDLTAGEVARKAKEFNLPFPVLKDDRFKAADALKAKTAPEAFVLDHNRVLRYRGRIDNGYWARLKKNRKTTQHDLRDALDDVLAGKAPRTPATTAVGCPIPRGEAAGKSGKVTYHRDVLPVLQKHCQQCHRPGEVGPFPLTSYRQAANWASDIKEYTRDRRMPPWKPVAGLSFHNERKLTDQELKTLAAWADDGAPEGDPRDAPKPRVFTEGWQLGKPDLVLTVPADMTVGASGKDLFRCFVLPTGLTEDKHVVAVEVRPGNNRIVHHSLNFYDGSGRARAMEKAEREKENKKPDLKDHGPGYSAAMGLGFTPDRSKFGGVGGWAPGQRARFLPEGTGYPLPKGSDFVLQLHYHRNGRVETDRTRVGLYFAKKQGVKPYKSVVVRGGSFFFLIPPGKSAYKLKGSTEVLADCELHSVMPHMHMLGKEIKVTMTPPGGETTTLVAIKEWDYNWQETYFLKQPIRVKKGTVFGVEAVYDNSDANPHNPFSPPQWVRFGEQTDNEMCFVFLGVTNDASRAPVRFRMINGAARPAERKP
jgi:thiol-disulfide isomerase/thioredoxin